MLKMKKVMFKEAPVVAGAINDMMEDCLPFIHPITSDNGKEFNDHKTISENLDIDYYFAHPYQSWERGPNENLNGLVRQYFIKKTDFTSLCETSIQNVENKLNNRPRKRYNYEAPMLTLKLQRYAYICYESIIV